ncbi:MAG: hypothetical protein WEA04_01295 [Candidatus Andersenbacteria bacterium]
MEDSIFLAKVIGLFGAISTLAILSRYQQSLAMEESAAKNLVVTYLSGFLILIGGILLVISHQVWTGDWRVIITIIGWLVLLKGVIRIFFPDIVKKLIEKKNSDHRFVLAEVATLLVSLYLVYKGFFGD